MASSMDAVDLTHDLQFCCPAKFANGVGIKIDVTELERLSPRSLNYHVLQDTGNSCSTGSSASVYMLSVYG